MEENKDKLKNSSKEESDALMEDTLVFNREPEINIERRRVDPQKSNRQSGQTDMQHTATKLSGGAVIRPLKTQPGYQPRSIPSPDRRQIGPSPTNTPAKRPNPAAPPSGSVPAARPLPPNSANTARPTQPAGQSTPRQAPTRPARPTSPSTGNRVPSGSRSPLPVVNPRSQSANQPSKLPVRRQPSAPALEDPENYREWQRMQTANARRSYARESATSAVMSAVKAVIYIVCVIAVSIPLSIFVINTANDVFAFVKDEKIIEVNIPEFATIDDIAEVLSEAGVIKYPWAFKLWSNLKERNNIKNGNYPEFIAGTYEVSTMLNYDYLRATFKKKTRRETINIMIPEGYTVDEIIELFVSKGIGTYEGFVDVINNYDFDYRFIDELTVTSDRIYRLEGYLFPDTYQFYTDSDEATVINKLLQNFNIKFAEQYYNRCIDLNLTVDQAITLASMIEKEAKYASDFGNVSSVFHNRLKYSSTFPYLNSDATIMYAIHHDTGSRLDTMVGDDTSYDSPYNTYTHRGLPPGPIANPGLNAIKYALYPNDSKYFYFVSDSAGHMLYAETDSEHQKNIITARSR